MIPEDFHTHNLAAAPGTAIVNIPREALLAPSNFSLAEGGMYSVGIHPWWTESEEEIALMWENVETWAKNEQIVAIGECGFDRLRGNLEAQQRLFLLHVRLSEHLEKPLTIHCVRAFDLLLAAKKELKPRMTWTVHGFRGRPTLARQLLDAGFDLSFGTRYNPESFRITPPSRRHTETDDNF